MENFPEASESMTKALKWSKGAEKAATVLNAATSLANWKDTSALSDKCGTLLNVNSRIGQAKTLGALFQKDSLKTIFQAETLTNLFSKN